MAKFWQTAAQWKAFSICLPEVDKLGYKPSNYMTNVLIAVVSLCILQSQQQWSWKANKDYKDRMTSIAVKLEDIKIVVGNLILFDIYSITVVKIAKGLKK